MTDTVRVSRSLLLSALSDAIDNAEEFIGGHDPAFRGGISCCSAADPCDGRKSAEKRLARYRQQWQKLTGHPYGWLPEAQTVTIAELRQREGD